MTFREIAEVDPISLALESLALAVLYAQYSLAQTATNPLVYVVVILFTTTWMNFLDGRT